MNAAPSNFQIKRLLPTDQGLFQQLIRLFEDVFDAAHPEAARESYLQRLLEKPDFLVFVILHDQDVLGGLTAYELPMYQSETSEILIYDIAVRADFQRRGLGKKLLAALQASGNERGIGNIFVAAHAEDSAATAFYHSTGGKADQVVHFTYKPNSPAIPPD